MRNVGEGEAEIAQTRMIKQMEEEEEEEKEEEEEEEEEKKLPLFVLLPFLVYFLKM